MVKTRLPLEENKALSKIIVAINKGNYTMQEIADKLGVTHSSIQRHIEYLSSYECYALISTIQNKTKYYHVNWDKILDLYKRYNLYKWGKYDLLIHGIIQDVEKSFENGYEIIKYMNDIFQKVVKNNSNSFTLNELFEIIFHIYTLNIEENN